MYCVGNYNSIKADKGYSVSPLFLFSFLKTN